ncbi:34366_t:CDS:2 [Gigaspora margarita]|uniref:34366_t:CDS:1 n=1 Tax=Gigaspora margarita TaxID=4874 RepID=A0ABN7VZ78_GIGMA|nr:34366_t:CDS:2 [Gigaspora margarita]
MEPGECDGEINITSNRIRWIYSDVYLKFLRIHLKIFQNYVRTYQQKYEKKGDRYLNKNSRKMEGEVVDNRNPRRLLERIIEEILH